MPSFRAAVTKIAKTVNDVLYRLSNDDWLRVSAVTVPSRKGATHIHLCWHAKSCECLSLTQTDDTFHTYTVPQAGWLFEIYMEQAASFSNYRLWRSILKTSTTDAQRVERKQYSSDDDLDQMDVLIQNSLSEYVGWLIYHVASIGTNGRRQLFYLSFVCRFYGLSRAGLDLLSQFGFGVSLTMFDEMLHRCRLQSLEQSRYLYLF